MQDPSIQKKKAWMSLLPQLWIYIWVEVQRMEGKMRERRIGGACFLEELFFKAITLTPQLESVRAEKLALTPPPLFSQLGF